MAQELVPGEFERRLRSAFEVTKFTVGVGVVRHDSGAHRVGLLVQVGRGRSFLLPLTGAEARMYGLALVDAALDLRELDDAA